MGNVMKHVWLGLLLIFVASAGLLVSNWGHRTAAKDDLPRIAFFYFSNRPAIMDCLQGVYDGLERGGYVEGKHYRGQVFDAQGDLTTANQTASAIVGGDFDMAITLTTPSLQTLAAANQQGQLVHVFGCVTDPFGAGIGADRDDATKHPAHLTGVGTFQPVERSFVIAREMLPGLTTVGTVWNGSESSAEACVVKARAVCEELGIELLEAQVDNANGVLEAAKALASKGVQAFWTGGDNTVQLAMGTLVGVAQAAGVPVWCNTPAYVETGALFGLGADYYEVGVIAGEIAGKIRGGADPSGMAIENVVPEKLAVNLAAMEGLSDRWRIDEELLARAATIIDEDGEVQRSEGQTRLPSRLWKLRLVHYTDDTITDSTLAGFSEQLKACGLVEGTHYSLVIESAHGETTTMMSLLEEAASREPDIVIAFSTPALQASLRKVTDIPIVFSMVADPMAAGAGDSYEKHLPNVTGISTFSDFEGMAKLVRECIPSAQTVGTLYTPSEINSVIFRDALAEAVEAEGMTLESVAVAATTDVPEAAEALLDKDVDVVCQISDNLNNSAFSVISSAGTKRKVPVFVFGSSLVVDQGGVLGLSRDYVQAGRDAVDMVIQIMNGQAPGSIPFRLVSKTKLVVNRTNAAACRFVVAPDVLARADRVVGN